PDDRLHSLHAEVAELADAHGSGPCTRKGVGVRVPSSAPILTTFPSNNFFGSDGLGFSLSYAAIDGHAFVTPHRFLPRAQRECHAPVLLSALGIVSAVWVGIGCNGLGFPPALSGDSGRLYPGILRQPVLHREGAI